MHQSYDTTQLSVDPYLPDSTDVDISLPTTFSICDLKDYFNYNHISINVDDNSDGMTTSLETTFDKFDQFEPTMFLLTIRLMKPLILH